MDPARSSNRVTFGVEIVGCSAIVRDITRRNRMEEPLSDKEERYESLYRMMRLMCDNVPDLIWVKDMNRRFVFANRAMCEKLLNARDTDELLGKTDMFFAERERSDHPDNPEWHTFGEICAESDSTVMRTREAQRFKEFGNVRGQFLFLDVYKAPLWNDRGEMIGTVGCARDVTYQRNIEASLVESEARFRELFEHASDIIYTHDLKGNYTSVNEAARKLLGYSPEEFMTLNFRDIVDPQYLPLTEGNFRKKVLEGAEVTGPYELVALAKDGKRIWLEVTTRIIRQEGAPVAVHGIARDMTPRKQTERALRESEDRYRVIARQAGHLVYDYDVASGDISWTGAVREITGYPEKEFQSFDINAWEDMIHPDDRERALSLLAECMAAGRKYSVAYRFRKKDGSYVLVEDNGVFLFDESTGGLRMLGILKDITERTIVEQERATLTEQLFHAQKMEAIGTLAGGIAHDFNNLLQVISGYSQLLLTNPNTEARTRKWIRHIEHAARSGSELVKGLLTLSRKIEPHRKPISLNQQVEQVANILSRTISKMIKIELRLLEDLPLISADPVQIEQVLMNLAVNARDAMPDGGLLVFETNKVTIDASNPGPHGELKAWDYVLLRVSDTGHGMDSETVKRIFDPFFTTKQREEGTGLGLSIAYGIVKQHGGAIRCFTELERGSVFDVHLPAIKEKEETQDVASWLPPPGGPETILLVDDDESVTSLGESMLTEIGYKVITAVNGKKALEVFKRRGDEISLVILDLNMPEMNGQRCLREIMKINGAARVIVASGYTEANPAGEVIALGARAFIEKPYDIMKLLQMIRNILDEE